MALTYICAYGGSKDDYAGSISALDENGMIAVVGTTESTEFGPGSHGGSDVFLARLASTGNGSIAKYGGSMHDRAFNSFLGGGKLVFAGQSVSSDSVDFRGFDNHGGADAYLIELDLSRGSTKVFGS